MSPELCILPDQISRGVSSLIDAPCNILHQYVITFGKVSVFGENHRYPRTDELIQYAASSTESVTHIVIETISNEQQPIDEYLSGKSDEMPRGYVLDNPLSPYGKILKYAKENGIKVIAGDLSESQMMDWGRKNIDQVNELQGLIPEYNEKHLLAQMHEVRSKHTGETIRNLVGETPNARILVSCGALHVALIAAGYYGIDPKEV